MATGPALNSIPEIFLIGFGPADRGLERRFRLKLSAPVLTGIGGLPNLISHRGTGPATPAKGES